VSFQLGGREFGRGDRGIVRIPVTTMASGLALEVTAHVLAGDASGPVVGLVSTHHGDEMFTAELVRRVKERLEHETLQGVAVLVPVANAIAFEWGTRHTPQDMFNLNRVFPGNPSGWVTEMLAAALSRDLLPKLDVLVDFHCGGPDWSIHYTYTKDPATEYGRRVHELALLVGAEVLWEDDGPPGTLVRDAEQQGVVSVIVEVGGGTSFGTPWMERGLKGVVNVLQHAGLLEGAPEPDPPRIVVRKGIGLRPGHGGLLVPEVGLEALGKSLPGGTVLARVLSPYTFDVLDVMRAPFDRTEVMMVRDRVSKVHPGEYAYILGDGDSGYTL
jgi:uncharacterized protein